MSFQINTSITKTTAKINSAQINSETVGTIKISQLLTIPALLTSEITANYGTNGSLVYDSTVNQFKGKAGGSWKTIASGASFSATDQQVLYYNQTTGQIEGATDALWQYDPTDLHLLIGLSNTSDTYLLMNPKTANVAPLNASEGAIKFYGGDLKCLKGGTWTSLTQVGTGANAAAPVNSIQFNGGANQFAGDANLLWTSGTETMTIGTPAANHGVSIIGTGSGIACADGAGATGIGIAGGANPQINMIRPAGGGVIINAIGDAIFTGIGGFLVSIDADNAGGSLVKSQLFQTYDPNIATGLQISSVTGGGGVNTITQILDFHTGQGYSFNYPLGPNGGMQLKANNMQFMQSGSGGIGSGFQFIFDNDTLGLGDSVFRIVKGITGQTYSNNSVFTCDGNGSLEWTGVAICNNIIPKTDDTFTLGSNPSNAWKDITVNKVNSGGALNPGGVAPNILVLNSLKIMPEYGFDNGGNGQDIGEPSAVGGSGAGGFRRIYAREFIAGANGNATGSFQALAQAGTSSATLSASGPDLNLSNSVQANSIILSTNSNVIAGGTNPALVFTNSSVGTVQNMILYGNNTVTSGDRDKIFNIGYDSTLTNSPVNGTSGYQMQFILGGAGAGKLGVAGAGTFTGNLQGGTLTDGTAQITGGVGTGFSSITISNGGVTAIELESLNSTNKLWGKDGLNNPLNRVLIMGEPVSVGGFVAASTTNGGISATIYGGLTILPNKNYNGILNAPMYDSNIIMGQYGWDTTNGASPLNVALSAKNDQLALGYGGSGNIYCNQIRQNIYSTAVGTPGLGGPVLIGNLAATYTGNGNSQYYNGGNVRYVTIAVHQEPNPTKEVILPPINEAMLGMTITIVRLRQNPVWYPGNNAAGIPRSEVAIYIYPTAPNLISAPESIFVQSGSVSTGGIALDPYAVLVGVAGYTTPTPYTPIGSATLVASSYGDGQLQQGTPGEYFWHYIDAYPGK